jgi:hypothetical protein
LEIVDKAIVFLGKELPNGKRRYEKENEKDEYPSFEKRQQSLSMPIV